MPSEIAQTGYVAIATQTVKGTPATIVAADAIRVNSNTVTGSADMLDNDPEIGGGRDVDSSAAVIGGFTVGGDLEGQFRPLIFGRLLLGAGFVAAAPVQDAATGAYTHTFTPGTPKWLTILTRWGTAGRVSLFSDCLVNELSLSLDANGKVTWSASIVGVKETFGAAGITPAYETSPVANYAGSAAVLDSLGTYRFESMGFTLGNNLTDDEFVIGSRLLDDVTPLHREVTATGSLKAGSAPGIVTDLYRAALFGSKTATSPLAVDGGSSDPYHSSAAFTFGSTKLVGTSTTKRYGITVTIPDAVIGGFPLESSGEDRLSAEVTATGLKGAGNVCSFDLVNTQSTQYA